MNKQDVINNLELEIKNLENKIQDKRNKIIELSISVEQDLSFMIREYENKTSPIVLKEIKKDKFTRILGGDGRSQPWDERVEGNVLFVNFESIYMSSDDLKRFVMYLKSVEKIDAVKINGVEF